MKLLLISVFFTAIFAVAIWAAPRPAENAVEITESKNNQHADGGYDFSYTLSDGTTRTEEGKVVNAGTDNESIAITGSFSYPAPDGQTITLTYVSDENGFQAKGEHLPVAPAAPAA